MSILKRTAALTAIGVLLAGTAGAASLTTTFDLSGNDSSSAWNSLPSAVTMTQNGITATFDAKSWNNGPTGSGNVFTSGTVRDARLGRYNGGAGVTNSRRESHVVDGYGWNDFIEIQFDAPHKVTEVSFGFYDRRDDFRWMYDSNEDGKIGVGDMFSDSINVRSSNPFSGFGGVASNVFGIGAFGDNDSWKLRSVTVETSPVPLPAAGLLLLGGLGGLGMMGRRKATKTKA